MNRIALNGLLVGSIFSGLMTALFLGQSASAAERVSARTAVHADASSGSVVSNKIAQIEVPQSVFVDTPQRKDPFFPNAKYRSKFEEKITVVENNDASVLDQLKLTGFGGVQNQRWAMINGVSIYENEDAKVRTGGGILEIVCLEIKERSVTVGLKNGSARREIRLEN